MGVLDFFTKGGNIGLVARNLTYIHETIKKCYANRFADEKSILRTTAFINLSTYMKLGQINLDMINNLIEDLDYEGSEYEYPGCFASFVFNVEKLIFSIDSPRNVFIMDEDTGILLTIASNIEKTKWKVHAGKTKKKVQDLVIHGIITHPRDPAFHSVLGIKNVEEETE